MEQLYHYIWQSGLFGRTLTDSAGERIEVLDPGIHNNDAGPDFFNSKIKIGDTEWVGNVEIHVKASDWYAHGHQNDPAYHNVILHVVGISDREIKRADGSVIPQAVITFPREFFNTVALLSEHIDSIRCASIISSLSPLAITDWKESLKIERVQAKAKKVEEIYNFTEKNWQQTCFIMVARALGFGLNGEPFEMLARSLPLTILSHHSDNVLQVQALLFGQAGMLDSSLHIFDEYYQILCREYYFMARKYGLRPMNVALWKYAKTRPQNFPHRRIAFLSGFCENGFSMFNDIIHACPDVEKLTKIFDKEIQGYWAEHFSFDTPGHRLPLTLGKASISLILINAIVPLVYVFGLLTGNLRLEEKAIDLLSSLPPEDNRFIRQWSNIGINSENAGDSQAILQLQKEYCDKKKCFFCRFGVKLLKNNATLC